MVYDKMTVTASSLIINKPHIDTNDAPDVALADSQITKKTWANKGVYQVLIARVHTMCAHTRRLVSIYNESIKVFDLYKSGAKDSRFSPDLIVRGNHRRIIGKFRQLAKRIDANMYNLETIRSIHETRGNTRVVAEITKAMNALTTFQRLEKYQIIVDDDETDGDDVDSSSSTSVSIDNDKDLEAAKNMMDSSDSSSSSTKKKTVDFWVMSEFSQLVFPAISF